MRCDPAKSLRSSRSPSSGGPWTAATASSRTEAHMSAACGSLPPRCGVFWQLTGSCWPNRLVSGGREPPPPALLEPYVTVSRHTAPQSGVLLPRSICRQSPEGLTSVELPGPFAPPHYRALTATTGRSPLHRYSQCSLLAVLPLAARPSLSGRQVLLFHASACDELTPIHRTPPRPHTGSSPTEGPPQRAFVPGPPTDPSFDAIVISFRCVSSGSHMFVFSSHTRTATARRQPQRSPPRLLTDAACGGLESPPARRPRRTYPHHWHSTDRADDLLHHHHHFPSGHTWVPEIVSWLVRRHVCIR